MYNDVKENNISLKEPHDDLNQFDIHIHTKKKIGAKLQINRLEKGKSRDVVDVKGRILHHFR